MNEIDLNARVAVLEYKVNQLTDALTTHSAESKARDDAITTKLDGLLELKSKGMGAFWLASTIVGTGIVGLIVAFANYLKG